MASTTETGHAKNVANFEAVTISVTGFGATYNPSRDALKPRELQTLLTTAKTSLNVVNEAESAYSNAVSAREFAFKPLSPLVTRVNNALKATDTTTQVDESAKTIVRKLQGARASAKLTEEDKKALAAEGKEVTQISASQMSYDSRLDNLDKFISLLSSIPQYMPNEKELTIISLSTYLDNLRTMNTDVLKSDNQLSNARISRNVILYKPLTGLVDIAADTKTYIKSIFGPSSPQFKQVSKLNFITPKQ